jgi:hypothetical protein
METKAMEIKEDSSKIIISNQLKAMEKEESETNF